MILDKKQMSEEDIKLQFITPAIVSKWTLDRITTETKVTDGQINLKGNMVVRERPKKADYVLYSSANNPQRTYLLYPHSFVNRYAKRSAKE